MCRFLAYSGESAYLAPFVLSSEHSLLTQSTSATKSISAINADGFGLGWYSPPPNSIPHPGRYREVLPAWADENLKNLCEHIQSPLFFAHIRAATGTATSRTNCHPFVHGHWMFMHNGQIGDYLHLRRCVENLIGEEHYNARIGSTDSEAIFLSAFTRNLEVDAVKAMHEVLIEVTALMQKSQNLKPLRFTAALSNGKTLYAFRASTDRYPPTLFYTMDEKKNCIVASEPLFGKLRDWTALPPNSALMCRDGVVTLLPFELPNISPDEPNYECMNQRQG